MCRIKVTDFPRALSEIGGKAEMDEAGAVVEKEAVAGGRDGNEKAL